MAASVQMDDEVVRNQQCRKTTYIKVALGTSPEGIEKFVLREKRCELEHGHGGSHQCHNGGEVVAF